MSDEPEPKPADDTCDGVHGDDQTVRLSLVFTDGGARCGICGRLSSGLFTVGDCYTRDAAHLKAAIEDGARAVFALMHGPRVVVEFIPGRTRWEDLAEPQREALRAVARAAIEGKAPTESKGTS